MATAELVPPPTTWRLSIVRDVDGDTLAAHIDRDVWVGGGLAVTVYSARQDATGVPVPHEQSLRLVTVDTPERGDHPGWENAKRDVLAWLGRHSHLLVDTYESAGWDRLLADVYDQDDRADTLTQYLMRDCGWPAWTPA